MAGNTKRGFAKMDTKEVSRIGKLGNKAQPLEAKQKGGHNIPHDARVRGGQNSHGGGRTAAAA
jgi:hypothetical protein